MDTVFKQLGDLIIASVKAQDSVATNTYRAIKKTLVDYKTSEEGLETCSTEDGIRVIPDEIEVKLLKKMLKEREDAIKIYKDNNRLEQAEQEEREASIIKSFLPQETSVEEIESTLVSILKDKGIEKLEKKQMSTIIKEMKALLPNANGKNISSTVQKYIS